MDKGQRLNDIELQRKESIISFKFEMEIKFEQLNLSVIKEPLHNLLTTQRGRSRAKVEFVTLVHI